MKPFRDKVALVTAGASGIGRRTVKAFADEGAQVVIVDLNAKTGERFANELRQKGHEALFVQADITRAEDVARMVEATKETFGRLDFAFNNAGGEKVPDKDEGGKWTYHVPKIHEMTETHWHDTINLNLTSVWLSLKYEVPLMLERGGGAVVNTTSIAGMVVGNAMANPAYSAAKAGLIHLSRYAAVSYGPHNIRVNVVAPGLTATPSVLEFIPEQARDDMVAAQPIPRMVQAKDLAEAVVWLCSEKASSITGHTLPVDAGARF